MPPKSTKTVSRPKSAGAVPDPEKPAAHKKQVSFVPPNIADDLFVVILGRVAEDVRLDGQTFPPPEEGYPRATWIDRIASAPTEKALMAVALHLRDGGDSDPSKAAARLVEELFALGLTNFRARGEPEDSEKALDGRAIAALLITHFLANHSASVASLRSRMPDLALDERRALWDALDSTETRWGGKEHASRTNPAPPVDLWPLQNAMHAVFTSKVGPLAPQVLADIAWALHESFRSKSIGDVANEVLADAYTMSVWAKEEIGPDQQPESEKSLLDAIVAVTPRAPPPEDQFMFEEPTATPVKQEVLAAVPSWAPSLTIFTPEPPPRTLDKLVGFDQALLDACRASESRRRQRGI